MPEGTEVGSLYVKFYMDDKNFKEGYTRSKNAFTDMGKFAKSMWADFSRLGDVVASFAKALGLAGGIGLGALSALATKSPYLAGELAKIGVESFKLGNAWAQIIKPIFAAIADDLLPALTQALEDNNTAISKWANGFATEVSDLALLIGGKFDEIQNKSEKLITTLLGGTIGGILGFAVGGPGGAVAGAGIGSSIGYAGATLMQPDQQTVQNYLGPNAQQQYGTYAETASIFPGYQAVQDELVQQFQQGQTGWFGYLGNTFVNTIGALGALVFNALNDTIEAIGQLASNAPTPSYVNNNSPLAPGNANYYGQNPNTYVSNIANVNQSLNNTQVNFALAQGRTR